MTLKIEIINPLEVLDWDQKILTFDHYSFFHSQSWARVLMDAYHYKPLYFTLWRQDHLCAVIPMFEVGNSLWGKKGVSLPFTDHCHPLATQPADFEKLFQHIIEKGRQWKWQRVDIKGGRNYLSDSPPATSYNLHRLDLESDTELLLKRFRSSTKRNIKKAQKKNIKIKKSTDSNALKEFYRLNCITRQHHGVPPQPFHFFRCIYRHILTKGHGKMVMAYHEDKPIAGAIFFHFGHKAMYKYGASRRDHLGVRPNNLVMWEAIKWYGQNDYSQFDMGRSEPDNIGLNQFKNGWDTQVESLVYYTFNIPKMTFSWKEKNIVSATQRIFQKMPIPILRIVGKLAYRHMG